MEILGKIQVDKVVVCDGATAPVRFLVGKLIRKRVVCVTGLKYLLRRA